MVRRALSGEELTRRAEALRRWYAGVAATSLHTVELPALSAVCGRIGFDDADAGQPPWSWGEGLPAEPGALLAAGPERLRSLPGTSGAVDWSESALRLVEPATGPGVWHRAESEEAVAFSTHAVAAAWLATGRAEVDHARLPELVAFEFVGDRATLLRGVETLEPATSVTIRTGEMPESSFVAGRRWEPVPRDEAVARCEEALLSTLDRRVPASSASVALTDGLDSLVVALALCELGVTADAFTWGAADWPIARGAARVAERLGMRHRIWEPEWLDDSALRVRLDSSARWSDGLAPLSLSERRWPRGAGAVVTGLGGEIGRAFYYADGGAEGRPTRDRLIAILLGSGRLDGASPAAQRAARDAAEGWLYGAEALGASGWRALDVVYAEQRVRRWARAQIPCIDSNFVCAFTSPAVARCLASLDLQARLGDGFHREFIARRASPLPRVGGPSRARRLLRRLSPRRRPPTEPGPDPLLADLWAERPDTRSWVIDAVLASEPVRGALGDGWVERVRAGFERHEAAAAGTALMVCGPVQLEAALRELHVAE